MKKFKKIYIEITNICNLSCNFCPKTERKAEFMRREVFEEILDKIKGHGEYLYFHVMGEPLLHPELGLFLDLCDRNGYKVNITTNGTLIDKVAHMLISKPALRQMNFSLHSFEANLSKETIESYLGRIFQFIRESRKQGQMLISLRLWNLSEKGQNLNNRYVLNRIEQEFNLDFAIEDNLTPFKGIKLAENIFLNQAAVFDWPDAKKEDITEEGYCYGLRDQIAVLVDGTVVPCCLDCEGVINLGNIQEQDLNSIIQGKRAQALYNGFSKRMAIEVLCRKCGYRTRFN